jgi:hypothetical protein
MATIENQNMVPKGWAYKLFMIADPLLESAGSIRRWISEFKHCQPW